MPASPPARRGRASLRAASTHTITAEERSALHQGRMFQALSPDLRDCILGRAHVWRLADGELVLPEDGPIEHWLGVASGEMIGVTRLFEEGQKGASIVLMPGVWMNFYSPLCDIDPRRVSFVASGPTCVLALTRADVLDLCERHPELILVMLRLSAMSLRYAHMVMRELQTCTLAQKQLRWLDGLVSFGSGQAQGPVRVHHSAVSQAVLAASVGVSRQTWNAGMARLEAQGVVQRLKGGLLLPERARLDAILREQGLDRTAQCLQPDEPALAPAAALPGPLLPIEALRDEERQALAGMAWFRDFSEATRERFLASVRVLRSRAGETIARADCLPPGWLCVLQGGLRLVNAARPPAVSGIVLTQLHPGATCFECALIDQGCCGVDVLSEDQTTLLLIAPDTFRQLLESEAWARMAALKWASRGFHELAQLKQVLMLPMPLRFHAWLDFLCQKRGPQDGAWQDIPMNLNQQAIAGWLSTTRQYVAIAMAGLERAGHLVRRRGCLALRREALPLFSGRPCPSSDRTPQIVEEVAEQS